MTEKQIQKIQNRIKAYRAILTTEKRRFGGYMDSGGIRYVIPELYFTIQDYKGALTYFRWFAKAFSDDIGFPAFNLLRAATLFENNKIPESLGKIYETAFSNTYLLELIAGKNPAIIDKSELIGFENLDYAKQIYKGCIELITLEFQIYLTGLVESKEYNENLTRYISLQKLIKDEPVGQMRNQLINESNKFERQLTGRKYY
jgi:hypothetical protein